jgi:hypothetical protein
VFDLKDAFSLPSNRDSGRARERRSKIAHPALVSTMDWDLRDSHIVDLQILPTTQCPALIPRYGRFGDHIRLDTPGTNRHLASGCEPKQAGRANLTNGPRWTACRQHGRELCLATGPTRYHH